MRTRHFMLALALVLPAAGFAQADECEWLARGALDQAFPDLAPWRTVSAGPGRCDFASDTRALTEYMSVSRSRKDTAQAAADEVRKTKGALAGSFALQPLVELGVEGFGASKRDPLGADLLTLYGHRDRLMVHTQLGFRGGLGAADRAAAMAITVQALAAGAVAGAAALEELSRCPHLDDVLLAKLLPGGKPAFERPEAGVCKATSADRMVLVSVEKDSDPSGVIEYMIDAKCRTEAVPKLGEAARISWKCGDARGDTTLLHAEGGLLVSYSYLPGRDTTEAERNWLIEMALLMQARRGEKSAHSP